MAHRLPRGAVDAEALSPRDANAQRMPKAPEVKTAKTAAQLKSQKNKEHPPPPPAQVPEPSSSDRPDGAIYQVGKPLGKGGFAICYEGQLLPSKQKYALKIVKSHMPPKMESKVRQSQEQPNVYTASNSVLVPNGAPNSFENEAKKHCRISASFLFRQVHVSDSRTLPQWFSDGHGQAPEGAD